MKTAFLIDGFNVYHSAIAASSKLGGASTKWLDLFSLCNSYLPIVGKNARIYKVFYFSALAIHLQANNPGKVQRHKDYIECLKSTGVLIELSRFKEKEIECFHCGNKIKRHEEKETDVAIAVKLIDLLFTDEIEAAVLVTGDTDLSPAVITAKRLFPSKRIIFAFPYGRRHNDLVKLAPGSFSIKPKQYYRHQFPDPVVLENKRLINKPASW